jgi:vacuolar-type H+-ATPase subunit H
MREAVEQAQHTIATAEEKAVSIVEAGKAEGAEIVAAAQREARHRVDVAQGRVNDLHRQRDAINAQLETLRRSLGPLGREE